MLRLFRRVDEEEMVFRGLFFLGSLQRERKLVEVGMIVTYSNMISSIVLHRRSYCVECRASHSRKCCDSTHLRVSHSFSPRQTTQLNHG